MRLLLLLLCAALIRTPAAEPLWRIGTPDGSCLEFGLVQQRWQGYAATYPGPIVHTVGRDAPAGWPYIHPSTRDAWAGGKPHTFTVRFTAPATVPAGLHLVIGTLAIWEPSRITVLVNGREVATRRLPAGGGSDRLAHEPDGQVQSIPLAFPIADGVVKPGDNTLAITLDDGSWIIYDYLQVGIDAAPPAVTARTDQQLATDYLSGPLAGVERVVFAVRSIPPDGHWYANIGYYCQGPQRTAYGSGGRLCVLDLRSGAMTALVDDPQGGVRDPVVHHDGKRILFSYRKGGSAHYRLYTIGVDGSGLQALTDEVDYDDYEPCWLPDGGIAFVTTRGKRWVNCWLTQVGTIWRCEADGSGMRPLSANLEHDNTPWVMPDGRLLYTRWEYVDRSQVDYHHLWTMNPDGTGQMVYYGNMHPGGLYIDAKPIPGTDEMVLINSPGHGRAEHMGHLATVNVRKGPDDKASLRNITKGSDYRDPWAFSRDAFMAARGDRLVMVDGRGRETVLFTLPAAFGKVALHEPRPIVSQEREPVIPSRVDLARTTGRFLVDDVHIGRNMAGVRPGEIKQLMIVESLPKPINYTGGMDPMSYKGTFSLERVLGTVPVEADGSVHFEAPALRSLLFVSLDAEGRAVKRMQSFATVQPGETFSCIGCHEERAATQPQRRSGLPLAARRAPSVIAPFRDVPDLPDFSRDIQPVLDRNCLSCHNDGERAGGVNLSGDRGPMFSHSYYSLTVWNQLGDGRNYAKSNLPPRALGSGGAQLMGKFDSAHHGVKPSERDRLLIRLWLDIGAPYPGTYAALGTGSIGGYIENHQVLNHDKDWPSTQAAQPVFGRRCAECHDQKTHPVAKSLSDEIGLSFWAPDMKDKRLKYSRHLVYNLTRPERSLILRAPLARSVGGLGLCQPPKTINDQPGRGIFTSLDDPDYRLLLGMCVGGKERLDQFKRFDMPGFRPHPSYLREMVRYGVLPASFDPGKDAVDPYELDRRYWESLWWKPVTTGR